MDHCREGKQRLPARILSLPSERPVSSLGAVTRGSTLQMSGSIGTEMLSKTVSLGLLPGSRFRCDETLRVSRPRVWGPPGISVASDAV